jgi:predicted DsbA family dithiol-disulfide isomerase
MPAVLKIEFVSDVSCPWCVIGYRSLIEALQRIGADVEIDLVHRPFELNPDMVPEGQPLRDYMRYKYGASDAQLASAHEALRARGESVGFDFRFDKRTHVYNTFDAHRLLLWANLEGRQRELKHALFAACFTDGRDISDRRVLEDIADAIGLDRLGARAVLESEAHGDEVRASERQHASRGITSVPTIIFNDRHRLTGGQPVNVFEQTIRSLMTSGA